MKKYSIVHIIQMEEVMNSSGQEDTLYSILRTDILELKLRPGMVISIKDISDNYGLGRSPVRDALIHLSKEGLITFLPQRGTMISKINYEKANNERFLRICVEENVMLEFMAACDLDMITELELSLDKQEKIIKEGNIREFLKEDIHFHSLFYTGSNREYCNHIINENSGDYRRMRLLSLMESGISEEILRQHGELVDALLAKDSLRMHEVFHHHLNTLVKHERQLKEKYSDLFCGLGEENKKKKTGLNADFLVDIKLRYSN